MQCSSVATTECCGNATLIAQRGAQAFPARIVSLLLELMPDELDKLVCQHGDDDAGCCLGLIVFPRMFLLNTATCYDVKPTTRYEENL